MRMLILQLIQAVRKPGYCCRWQATNATLKRVRVPAGWSVGQRP